MMAMAVKEKCKSDGGFDDHYERRQTEVERPGTVQRPGTEEDNNHISGIKDRQKVNEYGLQPAH
jgi:hypothetical protein